MFRNLWHTFWIIMGVFCAIGSAPAIECQTSSPQSAANAAMPAYVEEFFLSEAVRSEDKGELQSTLGAESFGQNGANAALEFEYGLTNRLQLSAEVPYGIRSASQSDVPISWSTVDVGIQYQFRRSRNLALTAGFAAGIPATSRGQLSWEPEILAARQFGHTQLHASFVVDISSAAREYEYNLASVTNLHSAWFPALEFNGRHREFGNAFYLTPGIYRHMRHRVEAGVAVSGGSHLGIVGKITWEVGGDQDER